MSASWVRCDCCGDFFCVVHAQHVGDCPCPPLEEWVKSGVDPYTEGSKDGERLQ